MRALLAALGMVLLSTALAQAEDAAPARRAVIVLDRGEAARESHSTAAGNALRIWASLESRGIECRMLAAGVDDVGSTLVDDVTPTKPGLAALSRRPVFNFRGPTDARAALAYVLDDAGKAPVDVILLGPFQAKGKGGEEGLAGVVKRWNTKAPAGSRIVSVRACQACSVLLADATGLTSAGRLVIGFTTPSVKTQPFSPFGAGKDGIEARLRVLADVLDLAGDAKHGPILAATSDVEDDRISVSANAGVHSLVLRRRPQDGRTATVTFARNSEAKAVHWLVEPPGPLTFRWDDLAKEARLLAADGKPAAPFTAVDVEVASPRVVKLRLVRTLTGPPPRWQVQAADGELPAGLRVVVGPEVKTSPEVGESEVTITLTAKAGRPVAAQGTLQLVAAGYETPIELAYEVRVGAGAVALESTLKPAALPPAKAEALSSLTLVPSNANAPTAMQLTATCDGGQEQWLRGLVRSEGGSSSVWDLTKPMVVDVGRPYEIAFELDEEAPAELVWPCVVTITPKDLEGVVVSGEASITVRKRRPRIMLGGPPPPFRVEDRTLRSDTPLVLRLDPDGGDGDYLLDLLKTAPTLRSRGGSIGWQAVARGQGVWHVVPTGEWSGAQPAIFRDQEEHVDLEIAWELGRTPGTITLPVEVKARWGKRGFIILSLALLALVLALIVVGYMRTPPVKGVLLYTVDGLDGTVGRLDLAAVGRKTRLILSDDKGKLSIASKGKALARVRPTRVGGMFEYTDVSGVKERRLLVDGVSLRLGRHIVRYVYGRPVDASEVPSAPAGDDLLGPEFDIESGKIDALDGDTHA